MRTHACLVCEREIQIEETSMQGEILECAGCGQEHELRINGDIRTLALAPEVEEDWGE